MSYHDTHKDSSDPFKDVQDWETLIKQIDTVERGSDGNIIVYMTM